MRFRFGDIVQSKHLMVGERQKIIIIVVGPGDDAHTFSGLIIKTAMRDHYGYGFGAIRRDWMTDHDWEVIDEHEMMEPHT